MLSNVTEVDEDVEHEETTTAKTSREQNTESLPVRRSTRAGRGTGGQDNRSLTAGAAPATAPRQGKNTQKVMNDSDEEHGPLPMNPMAPAAQVEKKTKAKVCIVYSEGLRG